MGSVVFVRNPKEIMQDALVVINISRGKPSQNQVKSLQIGISKLLSKSITFLEAYIKKIAFYSLVLVVASQNPDMLITKDVQPNQNIGVNINLKLSQKPTERYF